MRGVFPTFLDPAGKDLPFGVCQWFAVVLRRHGVVLVVNPEDEFTSFKVIRIDGSNSFPVLDGGDIAVKTEVLGFLCIWSMTGKALVGKDGKDFTGKVHGLFCMKNTDGKSSDRKEDAETEGSHFQG